MKFDSTYKNGQLREYIIFQYRIEYTYTRGNLKTHTKSANERNI